MYRFTFLEVDDEPADRHSILIEDYRIRSGGVLALSVTGPDGNKATQLLAPHVWKNAVIEKFDPDTDKEA